MTTTTVTIACKTLRQMLEQASRALISRPALAVLEDFLLEARGDRLFVVATNLETTVLAFRKATVDGEARALVPAKPFLHFVKALTSETVTLTFHERKETRTVHVGPHGEGQEKEVEVTVREVEVTGGAMATTFSSPYDPEEFPLPTKVEGMRVVVDAEALQEAIHRVAFAASKDPSRPTLQGVLLEPEPPATLVMVATDGYRLAIQRLERLRDVSPTPQDWILPAKALADVAKMLRKQKYRGWVVIDAFFPPEGEKSLPRTAFRWPGVCVALTHIEGTYPNWRQIVEGAETTVHVHVQAKALAEALKALKPALPKSNMIVLHVNGTLEVTTRSGDVGETRTVVPVLRVEGKEDGEEHVIGANWHYVNDVVKALRVSSLDLGLPPREATPMVISAGEDYRYLLMPMRLK